MSRVYDSWERLVAAVVNRETLRQIACCDSFSTSFSSDCSFSSSLRDGSEDQAAYCHWEPNEQMMNDPKCPSNGSSVAGAHNSSEHLTKEEAMKWWVDYSKRLIEQYTVQRSETQKSKKIVEIEPGVYITLVPLPNGDYEFGGALSRYFLQIEKVEKWWAANRTRIWEQHNIRTAQ